MVAADTPSTVTGMRGMVAGTVSFHGPDLDLHSGVFGGAVPNPATAIARLVAALHDDDGRVQVPGFYDDVLELTDEERDLFAKVPVDDAEFLAVAQSRALHGEDGFSTLERHRRPADRRGQRHRRRLPGRRPQDDRAERRVRQAVSFRLVADQDPAKITTGVEQFVADTHPGRHRRRRSSGRATASRPAWSRSTRPPTPR